jgi:NADPH:quinone reductase-like Zn-dependent oxidoreductase
MRIAGVGFRAPKNPVLGMDVAGVVEAVGGNVTRFQPGDAVYGIGTGSFAEYSLAREDKLAHKPKNLTFEQAAAVGISGSTALQALRDHGHVQPGQEVLIIGASGGVGTFAVQPRRLARGSPPCAAPRRWRRFDPLARTTSSITRATTLPRHVSAST